MPTHKQALIRTPVAKTTLVAENTLKEMRLLPELAASLPLLVPDYSYVASYSVPGFPHPFGGYPLLRGRPLAGTEQSVTQAMAAVIGHWTSAQQRSAAAAQE